MCMSVLLPLPDAPMMATYSPRSIVRLTPRSACTVASPVPYVFTRARTAMTGRMSVDEAAAGPTDDATATTACAADVRGAGAGRARHLRDDGLPSLQAGDDLDGVVTPKSD